jgi:hypothetical protein
MILLIAGGCFSGTIFAFSPMGHPDSIETDLNRELSYAMDQYGRAHDSVFARKLKAFLWDHRKYISTGEIPDYRLSEAAMCVLLRLYNYSGFSGYVRSDSFSHWCEEIVRR